MHCSSSINLLALGSLIASSPYITASYLNHLHPHPTSPLPLDKTKSTSQNSNAKSWLSHARDCLIQTIWRIPPQTRLTKANGNELALVQPPSTLLARYGGDLVLRFDISSTDEAEALAQAINVLFLDVWEFTSDWVDIRLSKDVVSSNSSAGIATH